MIVYLQPAVSGIVVVPIIRLISPISLQKTSASGRGDEALGGKGAAGEE